MTDIAIKIEHLNYVYSPGTAYEKHALKDICLEIPHGEFVGIIGHTGSGKSTLIQHLNGLVKATDGALYYNGENIYQNGYDMRALRNQVGLVFQYPEYQLFEIDVLTDVCFGPKNQGLSKEECEKRALEALKLVGLKEKYYKSSPFELSGGQKRRVAIAGVLAMRPKVLVLDEPTAGLDPKGRDDILDQIAYLHKQSDMTVILVSHSMEDIARYADRIIVMNKGSVMYNGAPKEVFAHYQELEKMGLSETTHFTNCVGIYNDDHYSTPYDMAMILKAAMDNDLCREVLGTRTYTTSKSKPHPDGITISNWFLRRIEDKDTHSEIIGAKTGFVNQSGSCAASMAQTPDGKEYICVTAGSTSSWRCIYDHVDISDAFLPETAQPFESEEVTQ